MQRRLTFPSLARHVGLLVLGLAACHLVLRMLMTHCGLRLGAVSFKLAPLYAYWRPHLKGWLIVPAVVLVVFFAILRRTRIAVSLTDHRAAVLLTISFVAIVTGVAMLDGGPRSLVEPFERTDLEYYGAVDRVHGVAEFLRDYPRQATTMPMHARVHPPGAVLFLWAACRVFGGGPWSAAAGIIGFSALIVPIVFRWAGTIGGPGVARRAAVFSMLAPSTVLFTATSMDGPFAVILMATMWLFWESLSRRPWLFGALAGVAATAAALMTYSVTVAILFCGIAACVTWLAEPARRTTVAASCAASLAVFLTLHALLWLATGYDPIEMFRVAVANHQQIMAGTRHESLARAAALAFANLVVFFIAAGLPCTALWWPLALQAVRESYGGVRTHPPLTTHHSPLSVFLATALATLVVAAAVPVYTLEVERVWMFLVPLVAIPVACRLFEQERGSGRIGGTMAVACMLAAQTLVWEVLLTTYW